MDATAAAVPRNLLSFDLEDWFHILGVPALEDAAGWAARPSIVAGFVERLLEELARRRVRATFFVVGWIAEEHPAAVARIAAAGHEIAAHSYWHRPLQTLTRQEFADDLARCCDRLATLSGRPVLGFRAPSFSVTPGGEWVFEVLAAAGLRYDSSLFPVRRRHGGYPCPDRPHWQPAGPGATLLEIPATVAPVAGRSLPYAGGGYFRLAPLALIRRAIAARNAQGLPAVIYLHPRDFPADWPDRELPLRRRLEARIGVAGAWQKLQALLDGFAFAGFEETLDDLAALAGPRPA